MLNPIIPIGIQINQTAQSQVRSTDKAIPMADRAIQNTSAVTSGPQNIANIDWKAVSQLLQSSGISDESRMLFADYIAAINTNNILEVKNIRTAIEGRLLSLHSSFIKDYTGKEDIAYMQKEISATVSLCLSLNIIDEKEYVNNVLIKVYGPCLTGQDKVFSDINTLNNDANMQKALGKRLEQLNAGWENSIWGTPERKDIYLNIMALNCCAMLSGVYTDDYFSGQDSISGEEEVLSILIGKRNDTGAASPDELKSKFIENYRKYAREYFKTLNAPHANYDVIFDLTGYIDLFQNYAGQFGVGKNEIAEIEAEAISSCESAPERNRGKSVLNVEELPEMIKKPLQKIKMKDGRSYYQYLKENVNYIIFSSQLNEKYGIQANYIGGGVIGIGTDIEGMKEEDVYGWVLGAIFHEARHSEWIGRKLDVKDEVRNQTISSEGDARKYALRFMEDMREQLGIKSAVLDFQKYAVKGAEQVIGNGDFASVYPVGIDTNIQPSNTPYSKAYQLAELFNMFGLIKIEEVDMMVEIFNGLILNNMTLEDVKGEGAELISRAISIVHPEYKSDNFAGSMKRYLLSVAERNSGKTTGLTVLSCLIEDIKALQGS